MLQLCLNIQKNIRHVMAAVGAVKLPPDPRIKADIKAAQRLFSEWPTPIVVVGREAGAAVPYPGASVATDYAWAPMHPVVEAYKAWKTMPYDGPSQALLAALYATDPKGDLLKLSEPGRIEAFTALASAKPAVPMGRGPRPQLPVKPAQP